VILIVDDYVYKKVEEMVEESKDLGMTKSESGYEILKVFFKVNNPPKDLEKIRIPLVLNCVLIPTFEHCHISVPETRKTGAPI
jgi:hypothetical protein